MATTSLRSPWQRFKLLIQQCIFFNKGKTHKIYGCSLQVMRFALLLHLQNLAGSVRKTPCVGNLISGILGDDFPQNPFFKVASNNLCFCLAALKIFSCPVFVIKSADFPFQAQFSSWLTELFRLCEKGGDFFPPGCSRSKFIGRPEARLREAFFGPPCCHVVLILVKK